MRISDEYKEKILYLFFGGLTTLVNIAVYKLFAGAFHTEVMAANAVAWLASVTFAYFTNKKYVFSSPGKSEGFSLSEMFNFFKYRIYSGIIDMALMYVLVEWLAFNDFASKIGVNVLVIVLNYIFSKFIIFK